MKPLIFKLCILLLFCGLSPHSWGNDPNIEEFVKEIQEEFTIDPTGKVTLSNKYGKTEVKTWNDNRVKVKVTITVNAKNEDRAKEVFERIHIDFDNGPGYVNAATIIDSKKNWSSWWSFSDKEEYRIDYEVFMPATNSLSLTQKYGDAFVEKLEEDVKLDVKYGNFRLEGAKDVTFLLGYGSGNIMSVGEVTAEIKYGKLTIKQSKDIRIESKYSKVTLGEVSHVRSQSKYDKYEIEYAESLKNDGKYDHFEIESACELDITSRYTDVRIEKLRDAGDFDLEYGGLRINELNKDFSEINISARYADCKLYLDREANYSLDAASDYAGISYPDDMEVAVLKDGNNERAVEGFKGSESGGKIRARLAYGALKVRYH